MKKITFKNVRQRSNSLISGFYEISVKVLPKRSLLTALFLLFALGVLAQPANDDCADAILLLEGANCVIGTNAAATSETLDLAFCNTGATAGVPVHSVWYKFVPSSTAAYTISCDNGNNALATNTQLKLLKGSCSAPTAVVCNEDIGPLGKGKNYVAAQITETLISGSAYYIMVDITGGQTGNFCINVFKNAAPANDCIANAINLTTMVDAIDAADPFECNSYIFNTSPTNTAVYPTKDAVSGDGNLCNGATLGANNTDHRDVWFKFTLSSTSPDVWISLFQNAYKEGSLHYGMAVYRGTYTQSGTCPGALSSISGLTLVDCSSGASYLPNSSGGDNDMAKCSTPVTPRLDISDMYADYGGGTYYLRIWEYGGGEPTPGIFKLCIEAAPTNGIGIDEISADRCLDAADIGCTDGEVNKDIEETYADLSNAGMQGNIYISNGGAFCTTPNPEEPLKLIISPVIGTTCNAQNGTIIQKDVNNSAIYRFTIHNAPVVMQARRELIETAEQVVEELRELNPDPAYQGLLDELEEALERLGETFEEPLMDVIRGLIDEVQSSPNNQEDNNENVFDEVMQKLAEVIGLIEQEAYILSDVISKVDISFNDVEVEGTNGAKVMFYVIPASCEQSTNKAVMSGVADCMTTSFELCSETGNLPNGDYFIIVDGQDGALAKYDMEISILHTTLLGDLVGSICGIVPRKADPALLQEGLKGFQLDGLVPVPVQSELMINYFTEKDGMIKLSVMGLTGQIETVSVSAVKGVNSHKLDVSALPSGIYIVQLENADGVKSAARFVKVN